MNAPVIVFAYCRVDKLKNCLMNLEKNDECRESDLFIFSDGPRSAEKVAAVNKVRDYLENEYVPSSLFQNVFLKKSEHNKGLANSIITGVTEVIQEYGKVIVVEDDLIVSDDFLDYMNRALDYYEKNEQVGEISAYTVPIKELEKYDKDVYLTRKGECWGWGTWKNRWEKVDWKVSSFENYRKDNKKRLEFELIGYGLDNMLNAYMDGKLDVWAVRWCFHLFQNKLLTVYPRISRTFNAGFDGSGEHCGKTALFSVDRIGDKKKCVFENLNPNIDFERASYRYECGNGKIRYYLSLLIFFRKLIFR